MPTTARDRHRVLRPDEERGAQAFFTAHGHRLIVDSGQEAEDGV